MKTQIISLDKFDDIDSIRDKMLWSKSNRMLLVFPKRGKILRRALDMQLLLHTAVDLGGQVALVTNDSVVIDLAQEAGIQVFSEVSEAQQTIWRSPVHPHSVEARVDNRLDLSKLRDHKAVYLHQPTLLNSAVIRVLAFTLGVLAVITLFLFFMPNALISLHPKVQEQTQQIDIFATSEIANPNVNGGIPIAQATTILELHGEAASTGLVSFPIKSARGSVVFTNLTEAPVRVPAGTILLALENPPIRFKLLTAVDVPGPVGATAEGQVEALQQGSMGNVAAGAITAFEGALGTQLSVVNPLPAVGGEDENSPSPSDADIYELRQSLLDTIPTSAKKEFTTLLPRGTILLTDSIQVEEIVDEQSEPLAGMPADRLSMTLRVSVSGWTYLESDLRQVAELGLNANLPAGFEPLDQDVTIQMVNAPMWENQIGRWKIIATRKLIPQLGAIASPTKLIGMQVEEAYNYLNNAADWELPPELKIQPQWWRWMPFLPFQYNIEVNP